MTNYSTGSVSQGRVYTGHAAQALNYITFATSEGYNRGTKGWRPDHGAAAITHAILELADALRPKPVTVDVKLDVDSDAVQEAVRDALSRVNRRAILDALSRESHADSPHGDGFVETRGEA